MLKDRIIYTLRFFDLQNYPLTLLELHRFLIADPEELKSRLDGQWELIGGSIGESGQIIAVGDILNCLDNECQNEAENYRGFYCLKGRSKIVSERLENYISGIKREKLIRRFIPGLRYLPFIRGAALAGSQAMGQQKQTSDIDLLIITDTKFMWLARTLAIIYFQFTGKRRHKSKVANRFCLNHYLNKPKEVDREKNLYKAMEYAKLRILLYPQVITEFQSNNSKWIQLFFPLWQIKSGSVEPQSNLAKFFEWLLNNRFGLWLERALRAWQLKRIKQQEYVFITEEELSFHPGSKHQQLLDRFFRFPSRQAVFENPSE